MRLSNIIDLLKDYLGLAAAVVLMLGILFFVGYKMVYQKVLKGERKLSGKRILLGAVSAGYMCILLGAVFLSRSRFYGASNLHLLASWREAWNSMSAVLFRNNILNILLFVPLGFLLPFYSDKLKKMYRVVLLGFLTTLVIESTQYVTKMGIFEADDLLHNTLGVLLGYSIFGIGRVISKRQKPIYLAGYVLPYLILTGIGLGMYVKYTHQELGNLALEYNYKVNMKHVRAEYEGELSNERESCPVYYTKTLSEPETRALAEAVFEKLGMKLDENETDIYDESALYYSENREYSVWVTYRGGTWSYTDFSRFSEAEGAENEESAGNGEVTEQGEEVENGEDADSKKSSASREEIESALQEIGIEVPENMVFEKEEGRYVFRADMLKEGRTLLDGQIICSGYRNGKLESVRNSLVQYEAGKEKEIISPKEAWQKILDGKFQWYIGAEPESIAAETAEVSYALDSKGYYVPIYVFHGKVNGQEEEISVSAIP